MMVEKVLHPVFELGPTPAGKGRVGIWTRGCGKRCRGCISPELRSVDYTRETDVRTLYGIVSDTVHDGVTISGGEPFDQASELAELVRLLREGGTDDILVYSGYTLEEIEARDDPSCEYVLGNIAVLVDGPYVAGLPSTRLSGSANQNVRVLDPAFEGTYRSYMEGPRGLDTFVSYEERHTVGIPLGVADGKKR